VKYTAKIGVLNQNWNGFKPDTITELIVQYCRDQIRPW